MSRPNILLIVADQHRYDCTGYSGRYPVSTPAIDRLAREGMWFTRAYTPIPVCCPARIASLTGRRSEQFGVFWNYDFMMGRGLEPGEHVWTRDLSAEGYHLGFVGKWQAHPQHGPLEFGYHESVGTGDYGRFRREKYGDSQFSNGWFGETDPVPYADSATHWLASRTIEQIRRFVLDGRPWHVRLDFSEPHLPCRPSEPFASMFDPQEVPEWGSFKDTFRGKPFIQLQQLYNWGIENYSWDQWAPTVARYYGVVAQMDDAIGNVLNALDEFGLSENTLVIYTTDHGDTCGGHRMIDKHYIMYEDVVRVPFVVRWPERILPGRICDEFVYNCLDLAPTVSDIAGIVNRDEYEGRSLVPLFRGETPGDWRQDVVSTYNGQQFGLYTQRMLRDKKWKYVWNATDVDELYDMVEDPDELVNLAGVAAYRGLLRNMRVRLCDRLTEIKDPVIGSPWLRDQLLKDRKAARP